MSIKANIFDTLLDGLPPANQFKYLIIIPGAMHVVGLANKVNWDSQKIPLLSAFIKGKSFNLPAFTEESSGILTVNFYETATFRVREKLRKLLSSSANPAGVNFFDILVINLALSDFPVAYTSYTNCWFSARLATHLSAQDVTTPLSWDAQFYYNGIHENSDVPFINSYTEALAMLADINLYKTAVNANR